jgi:hypothetical protein
VLPNFRGDTQPDFHSVLPNFRGDTQPDFHSVLPNFRDTQSDFHSVLPNFMGDTSLITYFSPALFDPTHQIGHKVVKNKELLGINQKNRQQ